MAVAAADRSKWRQRIVLLKQCASEAKISLILPNIARLGICHRSAKYHIKEGSFVVRTTWRGGWLEMGECCRKYISIFSFYFSVTAKGSFIIPTIMRKAISKEIVRVPIKNLGACHMASIKSWYFITSSN